MFRPVYKMAKVICGGIEVWANYAPKTLSWRCTKCGSTNHQLAK